MKKITRFTLVGLLLLLAPLSFAGSVTLSWTDSSPANSVATGYEMVWSSSTGETGKEVINDPSARTWTHTDLADGQTISYALFGFNEEGYSPSSEVLNAALHPESTSPGNTLPVPIYIAPIMPNAPGMTGTCSGNIQCTFTTTP